MRQLSGDGTFPPLMHWKPHSWSKHLRIFILCQYDTLQKNAFMPPPRPGDAFFGAPPSPTCGSKDKHLIHLFFGYQVSLIFGGGGAGAPPRSSPPRTLTGARLSCSHVGFLPTSITCKTNNGGGTPAHTFVVMPRECGFYPSNVDGWLIRNTLAADLRFLL